MFPQATPNTATQAAALKNLAAGPTLVNQLFTGKTTPLGTTIPKAQTPNVVAASSAVKPPAAPQTTNNSFVASIGAGTNPTSPPTTVAKTPTPQPTPAPTYTPQSSPTPTPAPATGGPAIPGAINQYQPTNDLYGQITTGLANTAATGNPQAQNLIGQQGAAAQNAASTGSAQEQAAYQQAQQYQQSLQQSQQNEANAIAGINGQPIPLEFQQGQARVLQDQYTQQQAALGSALQGESNLANIGLTGQGQGITGLGTAAGAANTAQGQTLSGLGAAGGLAAPQSYGLLNQPYNPVTDTYGGGGTSGAINRAQQAGNINAAESNSQAVGTAPVNAQLGVYNTQLQNLGQSQVAASQIAAFGDQLINTMSQPAANGGLGINSSSSQIVNSSINQLKSQFNDPQYATFNTNIAGLQARVSNLLQTGEIPTAATAGAQAIVNGNATLGAMQATLNQIQQEAGAITGSQAQVASTAYQQAQNAANGGTNAQAPAQTSLGTYHYVNGQWVPA